MKTFSLLVFALLISACSSSPIHNRAPNSGPTKPELADYDQWVDVINFTNNLTLSDPNLTLAPSSGGTSVYVILKQNGKSIGALLPENSATVLSGEILSFNLARAFGVAPLYQPGFFRSLAGEDLKIFQQFVKNMKIKTKPKEENRKMVLKDIADHPAGIKMVYKQFGIKPQDYEDLVIAEKNVMNTQHVLKGSQHTALSMLSCKGPLPNPNLIIKANGGSTTEYRAIYQLSAILLIDALTQQWDRFSGGNLQTVTENGIVNFISFDNGGTWGGLNATKKTLSYVTRFDKKIAEDILALNATLNTTKVDFYGLSSNSLLHALGIENFPEALPQLKRSLALVAKHIESNPNCYF